MRPSINSRIPIGTHRRAAGIFAARHLAIHRDTDRILAVLMIVQWVAGIGAALWISPRTWAGTVSHTHIHVWAAVFLGAAINIFPISLAVKNPGATTTRYVIATAQMMMSGLLIHLSGGRIETHFHVFGSLAFLAFYRDWRVLVPATAVVALDHLLRGVFWPQSVFGVLVASQWRWLEHAGWVLFEDAVLFVAIKRSVAEMWENALTTAELNDNEERYRAVVEQTTEGLLLSDVETFQVIECNEAFANLLGYTIDEALSLTAYDFVAAERELIENRAAGFLRRELPPSAERRFRRKDGSLVEVEINVTLISYGGKDVFCTIVRDIEERKRAEQELRESELRFRSVTQSASDAIVSADSKGNVTFWNRSAERTFGYTEEEILGMPLTLLMPQHYKVAHQRTLESFLATGETKVIGKTVELHGLRKDGTVFPFELSLASWSTSQDTFLTGIFRDITERRQAEEALRKAHHELEARVQERTLELAAANADLQREVAERKSAEDNLRNSEERYRLLFDSNPLPLWVYDLETLSFLAVNKAAVRDYGYSREAFLALTICDIRPSEDVAMLRHKLATLRDGTDNTGKWRHRKKDGSLIDVEITSHGLEFAGRPARIVLAVDITERKRMEDERQVISEIIQGVIATSDLTELLTLIHRSISRCVYAENCFVALYDETTDLMHFEFWIDKFDPCPAPRPLGVGFSSYVLRTGQPLLLDRELTEQMYRNGDVHKSGSASASWLGLPLKTGSQTIGVLVVQHYGDEQAYSQRDVDFLSSVGGQIALAIERKRAEEALEKQRAFSRQVIDLNPSFIFAKNREGRFTLVNQALADAYGTTVEALIGKVDAGFNSNQDEVEWFRRDDLEVMNTRTEKFIPEECITDASGNVRWLQTIKRPIISPNGTVTQMLGVATDITQRKKAEEALHESEERFRQAQKMESIGTLAGGIAHDFNNLMTAVTGYSELALMSLEPESPVRGKVEEIKKAGERAAALTKQLLAFSRKQILQPVVLDLNAVITGMSRMLSRLIGEDVDLRFELDASLGKVKADPGQLEQVLLNLAVNARDAMPTGGRVTMKTENVTLNGKLAQRHLVVEPGNYVLLSVSDNGFGMDAETQSHIFEPFFTTKEVGKGTGLGLATVYGIVKQSGGSIWVYSEVGEGTTFKIYLPRVDEVSKSEAPLDQLDSALRGHETILLVEDEEMVRDLSKEILEHYGYMVISAADGKEGLRLCLEFEGRIDLIITDVVMPQMGGRELAEKLTTLRPHTRVLYMSGFTDDAILRHGVDEGMAFVQKPFSPEMLALKAREMLDQPVTTTG